MSESVEARLVASNHFLSDSDRHAANPTDQERILAGVLADVLGIEVCRSTATSSTTWAPGP
jgi:hypothetical protein